jgi:hypothetical protein
MENTGGRELRDQAYETAMDILQNHQPYALPKGACDSMSEIVNEFEKELKKGGK